MNDNGPTREKLIDAALQAGREAQSHLLTMQQGEPGSKSQ
jgi:hypothetical protein